MLHVQRPNTALHLTPPLPCSQRVRLAVRAVSPVSFTVRLWGQRLIVGEGKQSGSYQNAIRGRRGAG